MAVPKYKTAWYIGVCESIRAAATSVMSVRTHLALLIPSMVDLCEFNPDNRTEVRAELNAPEGTSLIGWVGGLDPKKRVEDFIEAAAIISWKYPLALFLIVGGPRCFYA